MCCVACNKNQDAERGSIRIYTESIHYKTRTKVTCLSYKPIRAICILCLKTYQLSSTNLRT